MYHFFAEHENIHDSYIDIVGSDVNHIKNVLRFKEGDKVSYTAEIMLIMNAALLLCQMNI